jgi:YVTN family beta-propeller protein
VLSRLSRPTSSRGVRRRNLDLAYGANAVWVANAGDGTVSRIDPAANEVTTTITVGNDPEGIVVAENRVWVTVQAP